MARRKKSVTITTPGRDHGKVFLLTEMPPEEGEYWATRALELLEKSGELPAKADGTDQSATGAMAALAGAAALGINMARHLQDPSLNGMWQYVQFQPKNAKAPPQDLRDDHIEEWVTRLELRAAFFKLHVGFFSVENHSTSASILEESNS